MALNPYWLPFVQYKALFFWWLQVALGVTTAALVSMFVTPMTAGGWAGAGPLRALAAQLHRVEWQWFPKFFNPRLACRRSKACCCMACGREPSACSSPAWARWPNPFSAPWAGAHNLRGSKPRDSLFFF